MKTKLSYDDYHEKTSEMIELLDRDNWSLNVDETDLKTKAHKLEEALKSFGINVKNIDIVPGPSFTRFDVSIGSGTEISEILKLEDDIQMILEALTVRIIAPISSKGVIGIEITNKNYTKVHLRSLLESDQFKNSAPLNVVIGRSFNGKPIYCDLAEMPHLLIAGSTGSGRSICLNAILMSIVCKASPDEIKLLMVQPDLVILGPYRDIPHLLLPVDFANFQKGVNALKWLVLEMERRYSLFVGKKVKNLAEYNSVCRMNGEEPLLSIVCVIAEYAYLVMISKEVETMVIRLTAKAGAAGIHLIIFTQRSLCNVITDVIRNNLPSRIALRVNSEVESKIILDQTGAEKLIGKGDMLYSPSTVRNPIRVQSVFISGEEVDRVVGFLKDHYEADYDENVMKTI